MIYKDDRTIEQIATHHIVVWAKDTLMSGWGMAKGGTSYAGWACRPEDVDRVFAWVSNRTEMRYVRIGGKRPRGTHVHVYAVNDGHRALDAS
jgi:hypothetical protein